MRKSNLLFAVFFVLLSAVMISACSSSGGYSGRTAYHGGVGYGGYYGRPWGYGHPGYIGGIDPGPGFGGGPSAVQLPEMGMPDMGMDMGMGMDIGGFDF